MFTQDKGEGCCDLLFQSVLFFIKKKVLQEKTKKEGQSSIVKGVVFDQSREPLPGVSIVVQYFLFNSYLFFIML